jgi:hypothetical protein
MKIYKATYEFQYKFFDIVIKLTYLLTFLSFLGLSIYAPNYLEILNNFTRIYVSLFLIWRFNPFRKKFIFTELDRRIVFNAGIVVLSTTIFNRYIFEFKNKVVEIYNSFFR